MKAPESFLIVGCFGRPHGIRGFVTVHSFTEPRENILNYTDWHAFIDKKWQIITPIEAELTHKSIITKVEGYPNREDVALLTNVEIAVDKSQFKILKQNEYYWHQLIGLDVYSVEGNYFGKVQEILPTGSNDVLVVQGDKRHLIPYLLNKFVITVDCEQKRITVDWDQDF